VSFLILDGMLGYPAKLYDASWIEWGQMATVAKGGALAESSPWRTDAPQRSGVITYALDNTLAVEPLTGANSYALRADMVNVTDSSACGGGRGPGDPGPIAPGY
jgi:hypothetical protein